jgi:hypothetical protein
MSDASRLVRPGTVANGAQLKRPRVSIAKLPDEIKL